MKKPAQTKLTSYKSYFVGIITTLLCVLMLFTMQSNAQLITNSKVIASGSSSRSSYLLCSSPGSPWTWGSNGNGELGDGTTTNKNTPVQVSGLTGVIAISGGYLHTLFLKNDGTVWACGSNSYGQLGDGTTTQRTTPVQVSGLTGITEIAGGFYHSLFLKNDGTLWACGSNGYGQLGDGTNTDRTTPIQVSGLTGITSIAGAQNHSLFIKNDGTVWACGYNVFGELGDGTTTDRALPVQVSGLTDITGIAGGEYHSLFLKNDGTVWACGNNGYGQLGDGTNTQRNTPIQVSGLTGISAIAGGSDHSLFLKNDGTVWGCGSNSDGQLGDGTGTNRKTSVQVNGLTNITAIVGGLDHSLFLKNDGTSWATGANYFGELGNGTNSYTTIPVQVINPCSTDPDIPTLAATVNPICSGNATTLSIQTGNLNSATNWQWYTVSCGGTSVGSGSSISVSPTITTTYFVRGEGGITTPGTCASITVTVNAIPTPTITGGTVFSGSGTLFAGAYSSYLWSTGSTATSLLINTTGTYTVTVTAANGCTSSTSQYDIVNSKLIASGSTSYSSYFLCSSPTTPWVFGLNQEGLLGDGTNIPRYSPVQVSGLTDIIEMAGGGLHSLFLKNNGTVWASGYNFFGQLGDGTNNSITTPVHVSGLTGITAISGGYEHSLFLKNDGTVWACGDNSNGALGDGTTINTNVPVQVSGLTGITAISGGGYHSLFLKNDGTVWACGDNYRGQIGDGTQHNFRTTPVQLSGLTNIIAIAGGGQHSLFLKNDGTVWACGYNLYGALGDGTTTDRTLPVQVIGLTNITAISGGGYHSLFLENIGTVLSCGDNSHGQLGVGSTLQKNTPVPVSGLADITSIAGSGLHSLFLKNDGTIWACGWNNYGELGDGTNSQKTLPVQVINPCSTNPDIPTLSATVNSICSGNATTLSIQTGNLNSATNWQWYTVSCGGTSVGSGTSISVSPTITITYYVRGEGGSATPGTCANITVTVNGLPNVTAGNVAGCSGSTISLNGLPSGGTYNQTNPYTGPTTTYSYTYTDNNGCTNSATGNITVTPSSTVNISVSACDSYTWPVNGTKYDTSGTYTNGSGCYTQILALTITPSITYYADADGDTYGNPIATVLSCTGIPTGFVSNNFDCNDTLASTHPGALEICGDLIDNNCSGAVDEGCVCLNPNTANAGNDTIVCNGSTVLLNGSFGGNATNATWLTNGTGTFSPSAAALNATYVPSSKDYLHGLVTLTLTTNGVFPCNSATDQKLISFINSPANVGLISGTTQFCNPSSSLTTSYSIASVLGATSYLWSVPSNVIIVSGQGTTTLTIKFNISAISNGIGGKITVTANNSNGCGSGLPGAIAVYANASAPVQPGSVSGTEKACPGDIAVYSVAIVPRANTYMWSVPTNSTIISGAGTNIISVQFNAGFISGLVGVTASNGCGTSLARTRFINLNVLPAPTAINGPISGVCSNTGVTYSISNPVTGAISYLWTVPTGATIVGLNTGSSITVDFTGSYTGGNFTCAAVNNCGIGTSRSIIVIGAPAFPGLISGQLTKCTTAPSSYGISSLSGTSTYTWTVTRGLSIISGQGGKNISVLASIPVTTQTITVKATNGCGTTNIRVLDNVVAVNCPRIGDFTSELNLVAYPNPVSEKLTVKFNADKNVNYTLRLIDVTGRILLKDSQISLLGENQIELNVKGLSTGIYILQFNILDHVEQVRIVVN